MEKVRIYLGGDHAGFEVKGKVYDFLESEGYEVTDLGTFTADPYDYPDIAREVAEKVSHHEGTFGILLCGSGVGVCMAANKVHNVRAVMAGDEEIAAGAREHNNANVLTMGSRVTDFEVMKKIIKTFLTTESSTAERHVRRVEKLNEMV